MTKHDEPATLEQDGYASTRGLWDVLTGEDPIKPIITACLSGDDATLKSLLVQKQYAEAMLMKQPTIYDIREDQESSRDAQRVQSSEQSNLSRAMILAARENHASIVSTLLAFAAEHNVPYEDAVSRIFVIYRTMRDDKPDVMRAIAKAWPEVTKVDINHGVSPLYHAVKHGQVEMVDVLLKAGADPKLTYGSPPSFSPDPLVYAGVNEYPWVAQLLLQYGFPPENTCALHRAAAKGNLDTIRALAQGGVDVDGQWADDDNKTPLHAAAEHGQEEAMALLKSLGATDNKRDSQGLLAQQLLDEYKTGQ